MQNFSGASNFENSPRRTNCTLQSISSIDQLIRQKRSFFFSHSRSVFVIHTTGGRGLRRVHVIASGFTPCSCPTGFAADIADLQNAHGSAAKSQTFAMSTRKSRMLFFRNMFVYAIGNTSIYRVALIEISLMRCIRGPMRVRSWTGDGDSDILFFRACTSALRSHSLSNTPRLSRVSVYCFEFTVNTVCGSGPGDCL